MEQYLISKDLIFSSMLEQIRKPFFILKKWELTALPSFKRYLELIRNDLVFENIAPISFR